MSEQPPETPQGSMWEQLQEWKREGLSRDVVLQRLKEKGHDDESAKVLVNSVMGAMPSELPTAQLTGGTNVLAPSSFTLSDIGLTGPPHVVGQYWIGFGAAILLALGLGAAMTLAGFVSVPEGVAFYAVRVCGLASMTCIAYGTYRYLSGVTIRRKP